MENRQVNVFFYQNKPVNFLFVKVLINFKTLLFIRINFRAGFTGVARRVSVSNVGINNIAFIGV